MNHQYNHPYNAAYMGPTQTPHPNQMMMQPYGNPTVPRQVQPQVAPEEVETVNHVQKVLWRNQLAERLKISKTARGIVPSVVACMVVQAVAAFFFLTTFLTYTAVISNARDFSDDKSHDQYVLFIVFNVFLAIASALCAPMIQNSGYNTIVIAGTVLLLFSTMSGSLVTSAEILVIPYSVFGACAYALLKVSPQVAMLDYLNNRRALAASLSYLAVTVGQLAATFSYVYTDMKDDASYDGSKTPRWPNNLRVIEVTAVLSLMGAAIMKKPSFTTGSWPELFHYWPFYILSFLYFTANIGFRFLDFSTGEAPDERDFDDKIDGIAVFTAQFIAYMGELLGVIVVLILIKCCCGECWRRKPLFIVSLAMAILAGGSFIHEFAYEETWSLCVYAGCYGVIKAIMRINIFLAIIFYTGRLNYKMALPFLEVAGALGDLLATIILASSDAELDTIWYVGASLCAVFAVGGFVAYRSYYSWEVCKAREGEETAVKIRAIENAAFEPEEGVTPDYD